MRIRNVFLGLVAIAIFGSGCSSKRINVLDVLDLSYGTKTYGHVEITASDFIVVRFTKIEAIGYALENPERDMNVLRLFHCDPCDYFVGERIEAKVLGGDRKKDPLGYEISFIETALESEVAFRRLRHESR